MRIASSMLDRIVAQARAEAPNECCGIVGSRDGEAVHPFPARNARASPLAYDIDGTDLQRIYDELDERGLDVGIIYHSHTRSDPLPSQTDINLASPFFPDVVYVIVGVKDPEHDDVRAWHIRDKQVSEASLEVEEG
jgi:[CysO sulfur-carrier protein]-S-L-cysteine hydrolase